MLGMRVIYGSTVTTRYFHTDNLGSISVITDTSGNVVERDGYDAWGKRRFPNGADDPTDSLTSQTTRGFTAQEELPRRRPRAPQRPRLRPADRAHDQRRPHGARPDERAGLEPLLLRHQQPARLHRPQWLLLPRDVRLRQCGQQLLRQHLQADRTRTAVDAHIGEPRRGRRGGAVCRAASARLCGRRRVPDNDGCLRSHQRQHRRRLKAGAIAAATAVAFYEVGNLTNSISGAQVGTHAPPAFGTPAYAFNVVAHAAVGCGSAEASGQQCGPSALAGGVTSAAGPVINSHGFVFGLVANGALGGAAAVLGGGTFANGAITGAFGYLFNPCG